MNEFAGLGFAVLSVIALLNLLGRVVQRVGEAASKVSLEIVVVVWSLVVLVIWCLALIPLLADVANGEKTLWIASLWRWFREVMREGARGGKGFFK